MRTVRATAAVAVASALLLAACGAQEPPRTGSGTATAGPASEAAQPAAAALGFTARTLDGQAFAGETLKGKPVVLWFWAPWCPKCRAEAPHVKAAAAAHRDVTFVGVASLDDEGAMKEFVQQTGTGGITHLSDAEGEVWARFGIASQSTFLFVRPDGSTTKATGPLDGEELTAQVGKLRQG
ncbi:redoxin domain-containing protein [Actinomadura sp. ATCC 31491]|uniref:Redoxin domain-containing protein n=1 Tax=Actinomadura luzonensis TaxID=2805427 RepID=A0ABT0FXM6_9ACTN|nr:redoxin domain-containing protein [Actinomadura luzonensis]MCK2217099.1 redoxin domain-containing protein [Actinomadura luzonensis]